MKINLYGNLLGIDGYSNHTRQLFNSLYELNPDIKLEVGLPPSWMQVVNDAELNAITKEPRKADVAISISQPQFWRLHMSNCEKFVGFCIFEGSHIPKYWIEYLLDERVDQIWVPSQHTANAIINTVDDVNIFKIEDVVNKIKIVPHGIDLNIFKPQEVKNDKFTFVVCKGWRGGMEDRGGVGYALKAFSEEFRKDENVQLIVKLNPSYLNPSMLKQKLDELKLSIDRPEIKINIDAVAYKKLPDFYKQGDIFVSSTRADAFGLTTLEAMGCGLPVIQTSFGGQTDFVNEGNGWLLDYKLEEVKEDLQYEGIQWATPDIPYLRKLMRYCYDNKEEVKEKGKQAIEDSQNWTWSSSAQKALAFLKEIN